MYSGVFYISWGRLIQPLRGCDIQMRVSSVRTPRPRKIRIRLKLNILKERGETACLENCPRASSFLTVLLWFTHARE